MSGPLTEPSLQLVVDLVEKVGLLKRQIAHRGDEAYTARLGRIEQKVEALAAAVAATHPAQAEALRAAWHKPARSLALRNAAHQTDLDR
jgi:hypothetical protein